jgi:3-isopropylmalate/(R)-2-methylmalate dehydratase large subunit
LLARIERGEHITLADLVQGREALGGIGSGSGWFAALGAAVFVGRNSPTGVGSYGKTARDRSPAKANGPQTLFEKILMRHRLTAPHTPEQPQPGDGLFVQADWRFIHEYYTGMADTLMKNALGKDFTLQRPNRSWCSKTTPRMSMKARPMCVVA